MNRLCWSNMHANRFPLERACVLFLSSVWIILYVVTFIFFFTLTTPPSWSIRTQTTAVWRSYCCHRHKNKCRQTETQRENKKQVFGTHLINKFRLRFVQWIRLSALFIIFLFDFFSRFADDVTFQLQPSSVQIFIIFLYWFLIFFIWKWNECETKVRINSMR